MLCPTRFAIDATESSKGGVAAEIAAPRLGYEQIKMQHIIALT